MKCLVSRIALDLHKNSPVVKVAFHPKANAKSDHFQS